MFIVDKLSILLELTILVKLCQWFLNLNFCQAKPMLEFSYAAVQVCLCISNMIQIFLQGRDYDTIQYNTNYTIIYLL